MKGSIIISFLLLLACTSRPTTQAGKTTAQSPEKALPNIVFILADDMGYGDAGCYNSESRILTPAIDRLAAEGIRFTDAHAPGAWCVPSRYGFITGQYPLRAGMDLKRGSLIAKDRLTVGALLQRNGYRTAMIGKWHLGFEGVSDWDKVDYSQPFLGGPVDRGFDYFFGMHASLDIPPYFYLENNRCVTAPTDSIAGHQSPGATTTISGAFWRGGKIAPDFKHQEVLPTFTRKAVSFMESHVKEQKKQPFFLYVALTAPHTPWVAQQPFKGKSQAGEYGDFTMQVDHTVGEVLQALERLGIQENTLVIFTSDNGPVWFKEDVQKYNHRSAGNFRGMKLDAWEGGHRIPFIARWPGKIKPHTTSAQPLCFTDMLATFAAAVGDSLPREAGRDSYNMLPVMLGSNTTPRKGLIVEGHTVREGDWKLIFGSGLGVLHRQYGKEQAQPVKGELYNLQEDPSEANNLYDTHPEKVAELTRRMEQYRAEGSAASESHSHK